jgi:hypothetical protein
LCGASDGGLCCTEGSGSSSSKCISAAATFCLRDNTDCSQPYILQHSIVAAITMEDALKAEGNKLFAEKKFEESM